MKYLPLSTVTAFLLLALANPFPFSVRREHPGPDHLVSPDDSAAPSTLPSQDTFVRVTAPDTNFDTQDLAVAASKAGCTPTDTTYLQWDLSDIDDIETVLTATLTLTATFADGTSSAQLSLYETDDAWTEDYLNYNNAPSVGTLIETVAAPLPGYPPSPAIVAFNSVTLTTYIDTQAHGDGVASFALRFSDGCGTLTLALFDDTESGTNGPGLVLEIVTYAPDLAIQKTAPDTAHPGGTITYTLAYSNTGNVLAQQVVISDLLPAGVASSTATYTYTGASITPRAGSPFVWDVTDLSPGAGGTITITASISPTYFADTLSNTATIATSMTESRLDNNTAAVTTTVIVYRHHLPLLISAGTE
jgi:uncharacterized repeat protein (TIGR01451 family)